MKGHGLELSFPSGFKSGLWGYLGEMLALLAWGQMEDFAPPNFLRSLNAFQEKLGFCLPTCMTKETDTGDRYGRLRKINLALKCMGGNRKACFP